jgi:hypothetical protein
MSKVKCDFCGEKGTVNKKDSTIQKTTYGTSHYTRFICNTCKEKIESMGERVLIIGVDVDRPNKL